MVATCPCGAKFVIGGTNFPRPVACHNCGARTVLQSPTELCADSKWSIAEESPPGADEAGARPGAVKCFLCKANAFAACARCGRFYCSRHGRARFRSVSTCTECYDGQRPGFLFAAAILVVGGICFLLMPLFILGPQDPKAPYYGISIPVALAFLAAGAANLWFALRAYP